MILGVDPGRDKIGWALTGYNGSLFSAGICSASEQEVFLTALTRGVGYWKQGLSLWMTEKPELIASQPEELSLVAIGNGTGSREAVNLFKRLGVKVIVVSEKGTTLEARGLYWEFHSPSWWQRCLPRVMWIPPRPLDDLAAWVIAKRSLQFIEGSNRCCGQ